MFKDMAYYLRIGNETDYFHPPSTARTGKGVHLPPQRQADRHRPFLLIDAGSLMECVVVDSQIRLLSLCHFLLPVHGKLSRLPARYVSLVIYLNTIHSSVPSGFLRDMLWAAINSSGVYTSKFFLLSLPWVTLER
jgi:hypothetical protein